MLLGPIAKLFVNYHYLDQLFFLSSEAGDGGWGVKILSSLPRFWIFGLFSQLTVSEPKLYQFT